jgi:hypothetical protein
MNNLTPESRAFRAVNREMYAGFIGFVIGFFLTFAVLAWTVGYYVAPDAHWWQVFGASLDSLMISFFGGLCFAVGAYSLVRWFHFRSGVYRCSHCGKPLRTSRRPCDCHAPQIYTT